jgi:cyclohexanecarboxylate-CoA ligase
MASPIAHTTALIVGPRLPVMYGMTTVWQEHWHPEAAIELIARERSTFTLSATPFLHGPVHVPNANPGRSRPSASSRAVGRPSRAS